jgi:hypothetical protein
MFAGVRRRGPWAVAAGGGLAACAGLWAQHAAFQPGPRLRDAVVAGALAPVAPPSDPGTVHRDEVQLLRDVALGPPGPHRVAVSVTGPSGCGKTHVVRAALGRRPAGQAPSASSSGPPHAPPPTAAAAAAAAAVTDPPARPVAELYVDADLACLRRGLWDRVGPPLLWLLLPSLRPGPADTLQLLAHALWQVGGLLVLDGPYAAQVRLCGAAGTYLARRGLRLQLGARVPGRGGGCGCGCDCGSAVAFCGCGSRWRVGWVWVCTPRGRAVAVHAT